VFLTYNPDSLNDEMTHQRDSGTALHLIALQGKVEVVQFLLNQQGIDYEALNLRSIEDSHSVNEENKKKIKELFKQKR